MMSLVYYGRGTLGKIKKSVNTVSIGYMPDDSGRKPAFLNVRIIISDQFSYRYHIIAFYGDLNCPDYYLSLNLGTPNCSSPLPNNFCKEILKPKNLI